MTRKDTIGGGIIFYTFSIALSEENNINLSYNPVATVVIKPHIRLSNNQESVPYRFEFTPGVGHPFVSAHARTSKCKGHNLDASASFPA